LPCGLVDAVRRDLGADGGGRVDARPAAYDAAGVQHAVAAHLHAVAQDGAELLHARLYALRAVFHDNEGLVALDVGGDAACAHMRAVAQDGVAHVVIVRGLHLVEQDDVLELHGVAHDAALADDGAAAYKRAMPHLGLVVDDTGAA